MLATFPPTRWLSQQILHRVERPRLRALIDKLAPDVGVSTWPLITEVLARMRANGEIAPAVASAITDISALRVWAAAGIDPHLVSYPESEPEVPRIAGPDTHIACVHGVTQPQRVVVRSRTGARVPRTARRRTDRPGVGRQTGRW